MNYLNVRFALRELFFFYFFIIIKKEDSLTKGVYDLLIVNLGNSAIQFSFELDSERFSSLLSSV